MKKSLKSAIVTPFVIIFFITFIGVTSVQLYNFEQRIVLMGEKKMLSITDSIKIKLDHFLKEPLHLGVAMANLIASSSVKKEPDLTQVQDYFHSAISDIYEQIPQIDIIGYGSNIGEYVGFLKGEDGNTHLILQDERTSGKMTFFDGDSTQSATAMIVNNYEPRERPWYLAAQRKNIPTWSGIYTSAHKHHSTISASVPILDESNNINGVLALDIGIDVLNDFMLDLKNNYNVMVYIFNSNGNLISHSGTEHFESLGYKLARSHFNASVDPVVVQSLEYISDLGFGQIEKNLSFKTDISGKVFFNSVTPYIVNNGDSHCCYIGISVPKDDLYDEVLENRIRSWIIGFIICAFGLFIVACYISEIISPIELTIAAANQLAAGHKIGTITNNSKIKEIRMLVTGFNRLSMKIESTIKTLKNKAFIDELTGLLTKAGLVDNYRALDNKQGTLFIFSIGTFKSINDSLGYEKGDLVLKEVANRLNKFIEDNALIARIDGGKFALYLPRVLDFRQSKTYAKSIKQFLTERLEIDDVDVAFRIAVGVVTETQKYSGMDLCLRNASIALSEGKKGQGRVFHFSDEMLDAIEHKTQMCAEIKNGLEKHEFRPFYQPIVNLKTGKPVGAEALARWISPTLGMVPPDKFIPIAEEHGFIGQLGESILFQACEDVAKGIAEGKWPEDFKMHVNISVLQITRSSFLTGLQDVINSTNVNPKNLSLEITESGLVENTGIFNRNLEAIIAMGIHVSIDDFGTGYSSLSYLQQLEFDCLKIDRAFISTLTEDNYESSLTAMIVNISNTIDTYVVAEGIETETQAELLIKLNCQFGQGYYFGRPMPYDDWAMN